MEELLKTCRRDPLVWVERIALFESREHERPFRDIPLGRGINVVWARDSAVDRRTLGHGVGKTTLCRLIRYCLGEKTYANKALKERIQKHFPDAYVAAEVWVGGEKWAVARPLELQLMDFARRGTTIEDLLTIEKDREYPSFLKAVDLAVFSSPVQPVLPGSGQSLTWLHVLAWCARDQEAHFDTYGKWRDPRSESESPSFQRPTVDPIEAVRYCLGLVGADEPALESKRKQLQTEVSLLSAAIARLEQAPKLMRDQLADRLRLRLGLAGDVPVSRPDPALIPNDILGHIDEKIRKVQESSATLESELFAQQAELVELAVRQKELAKALATLSAIFEAEDSSIKGYENDKAKRAEIISVRSNPPDDFCELGGVTLKACSHIASQKERLNFPQMKQDKESDLEYATRMADLTRIEGRLSAQRAELESLDKRVSGVHSARRATEIRLQTLRVEMATLESQKSDLAHYDDVVAGKSQNTPLQADRDLHVKAAKALAETQDALELRAKVNVERTSGLSKALSSLSEALLPGTQAYADLGDCANPFKLVGRGGEAMRVMENLLGDTACALFSSANGGHHPGLIIHDSPREADMGEGLYTGYMNLLLQLGRSMASADLYPMQYIVTTTSDPGEQVDREFVKLKLHAESPDGYLFRKSLDVDRDLFSE